MRIVISAALIAVASIHYGCNFDERSLSEKRQQSAENRKRSAAPDDDEEDEEYSDSGEEPAVLQQRTRATSKVPVGPMVRLEDQYRHDYPKDFKNLFPALTSRRVTWNGMRVHMNAEDIKSSDVENFYKSISPEAGLSGYMIAANRQSSSPDVGPGCSIGYERLVHFAHGGTFGTDYLYFVDIAYAGSDPTLKAFDGLIRAGGKGVERRPFRGFNLKREDINNSKLPNAVASSIATTVAKEAGGCAISGIRVGKMEKWGSITIHPILTYTALP